MPGMPSVGMPSVGMVELKEQKDSPSQRAHSRSDGIVPGNRTQHDKKELTCNAKCA